MVVQKTSPEQIWKLAANAFSWSASWCNSKGTAIHTSRNAVGIDDRSMSVPKIMAGKIFFFPFLNSTPDMIECGRLHHPNPAAELVCDWGVKLYTGWNGGRMSRINWRLKRLDGMKRRKYGDLLLYGQRRRDYWTAYVTGSR